MLLSVPLGLMAAAKLFHASGAALYLVGGRPRNALLGLPSGDWDVAGPLLPDAAAELFRSVPEVRVHTRDTALGTLGVLCDGQEVEYTPFRAESYGVGGEHRPQTVRFGVPMEADALRRDFTVNALYWNIAEEQLIDPLGGQADLSARVLRTCRTPAETFDDDGLRLMRLVRFCAELNFAPEDATARAAAERAHLLRDISPERLWVELTKLLLADTRYPDGKPEQVARGLNLLEELRLLDVLLPELGEGRGIAQRAEYHAHDVLGHGLAACAAAPAELTLRLAALLHDVGKPAALRQGGRMLGHDKLGAEIAAGILTHLRCPKARMEDVCALIAAHMVDLDGRMGENKLRLFFVKLGHERTRMLIELRRADVRGSKDQPEGLDPAEKWVGVLARMEADGVPWTLKELQFSGEDATALIGAPGPKVGQLLNLLHRHAIQKPKDNTRAALTRLARQFLQDTARWGG